jgi:2-dehydro-3-deoxyphosphooctonate aldolase (KDO 8-P synthase)
MHNSLEKTFHLSNGSFFLIAGPCVIEGEQLALDIAGYIKEITGKLGIPFVFKGSYRKANRSRLDSFTGIGDKKALGILKKVAVNFDIPVLTDIHESSEAAIAAAYVDVIQIPAFLFRQTELLVAAAKTGLVINIKKGQFAAANAMPFAIDKVADSGNPNIWITERGNMFGYGDLIVDFRNIPEMRKTGKPVVMDITHSLQQPNQASGVTGGKPYLIETIGLAAMATGADGIFIETHPNPGQAKSDGANMLALQKLETLLEKMLKVKQVVGRF